MSWKIEGHYFENCTCEVACPCTASLALGADYDRCNAVPMVFRSENGRHSLRMGGVGDLEVEDVVPFGVETGEPARMSGIFHPVATELTISKAGDSRLNAFGLEPELAGKSGFSTPFAWSA